MMSQGNVKWFDKKKFMKKLTLLPDDCYSIILPRKLVQDIDTPEDWEIAEYMFKIQDWHNE